jgi:hypothetical protein
MRELRKTKLKNMTSTASLPATDPRFLDTLESWLAGRPEILVLLRYAHAAGAKGFEFATHFPSLAKRIRELPPLTSIIAFKQPQLPFRGVVDDEFITRCVAGIPDDSEYLVVELVKRVQGRNAWYLDYAGISLAELQDDLEESRGVRVAAGLYPVWHEDSDDVISAVMPETRAETRAKTGRSYKSIP